MSQIDELRSIIENSENAVAFTGAGCSTESNIPDFRSEAGLYSAMSEYGYPPEYIISRPFFDRHMEIFYDYYKKNLVYRDAEPNQAHIALAKLEAEGKLKGVITQNIDGLHQMAGSKNVCELHGSIMRNRCMQCAEKYDLDFIMDEANCTNGIPKCPVCGGVIKPDVVLYEEQLGTNIISQANKMLSEADTLIVGGTSLVVYPAAGMVENFKGKNLVLINKSETSCDEKATLVINDYIGKVLSQL